MKTRRVVKNKSPKVNYNDALFQGHPLFDQTPDLETFDIFIRRHVRDFIALAFSTPPTSPRNVAWIYEERADIISERVTYFVSTETKRQARFLSLEAARKFAKCFTEHIEFVPFKPKEFQNLNPWFCGTKGGAL